MKEATNINYTQRGMYLYPNIVISETDGGEKRSLGKYGLMRSRYLKEHQPLQWGELLMKGTLMEHLHQVDNEATERVERMVERMAEKAELPDRKTQPVEWAQNMAMLKAQAEEVVVRELIYDN